MFYSNDSHQFYHGKISRDVAISILDKYGHGQDGYFLIRDSSRSPGDYVLSLWFQSQVMHFQVHCLGDNKFAIDDGPIFHGLDSLTAHYGNNADGLPHKLTGYAPGKFPPLNAVMFGADTQLHIVCQKRSISQVAQLLQDAHIRQGVDGRNSKGQTALHIACTNGDDDIVAAVLGAKPNISATDSSGRTAVQVACMAGHASTLRILILQGKADFHERNSKNGWVPLHEVCMRGFVNCIKTLLSFNASMHPRTLDGDTPRDLAIRYGHNEVVDLLDTYPVQHPKTQPKQWLHQNLDRTAAVNVLQKNGLVHGSFLIRNSIKCHGYYVLSLVSERKVFHFQIKSRADRWFYIDDGPLFETLPHLVDHYLQYADGLPCVIKSPVQPQTSAMEPTPLVLPQRPPVHQRSISHDDEFGGPMPHNAGRVPPIPASRPQPPIQPPSPQQPTKLPPSPASYAKRKSAKTKVKSQGSMQQTVIPRESLQLGKELGLGEFGSVLKGVWTSNTGEKVAVALKTLHQDKLQQGEKEFLREARVMSQLDHPCIVRLLGVCLGPPMILVQELVSMGALLDHLIDHQDEIEQVDLKLWASQIAMGMMYLEQKRFVHRDLATRNILLAHKNQAKISDFGLSRAVGAGSDYYQAQEGGRWPVKWYAPESINYGTFSQKSDVWSYGVTLWEMFTFGELPYGELSGAEVIALLEKGERLQKPDDCPNHTYEIMLKCWNIDPGQRPTFRELHSIFATDPEYEDARKYRDQIK